MEEGLYGGPEGESVELLQKKIRREIIRERIGGGLDERITTVF